MTLIYFSGKTANSDDFILRAVRAYCDITGSVFAFSVARTNGIPYLVRKSGAANETYVSLSHSGEYIVCAVAEEPIGVDIQEEREVDFAGISKRIFGKEVRDKGEFYELFCGGEARKKMTGEPLLKSMAEREPGARTIRFFKGYTLAICGGDVALTEEF